MSCQRLDKDTAVKLIAETDTFLFDWDGVLYDGKGAIPGSVETISHLKRLGKKVFYVTNNSTSTRKDYQRKCQGYGYDAEEDDIMSSGYSAALYLHNLNFKGKVYVVGNQAMGEELDSFNIRHIGIGADEIPATTANQAFKTQTWSETTLDPEINCVLVGFDPYINYTKILKACSYLEKEGCLFLATNSDSHIPAKGTNLIIPGTGTMVMAVSVPARKKPIIVGKPESTMFDVLSKANNLDPSRCMMVGDQLDTDILMAKNCNLKSLLVLSGVCSEQDLPQDENQRKASCQLPDFYADSLGVLGNFIAEL